MAASSLAWLGVSLPTAIASSWLRSRARSWLASSGCLASAATGVGADMRLPIIIWNCRRASVGFAVKSITLTHARVNLLLDSAQEKKQLTKTSLSEHVR